MGAITPDGKHLLVGGYNQKGEIVRYDPASKQIVPYLGGISATQVAFSKDGKSIAYINVADDTLWTAKADGTSKVQLTYPAKRSALPRWSPDGSKVAFISAELGKPWKAFTISGQGGTAEELLPADTAESDPAWSPDGKRLVFSRLPDTATNSDIRILDLSTHQVSIRSGLHRHVQSPLVAGWPPPRRIGLHEKFESASSVRLSKRKMVGLGERPGWNRLSGMD